MTDQEIRVGVVGAGANTRGKHIPGLRAINGVEIVSVCNRTRASSERAAKNLGIPRVYDTWRELVEAPDTDAIVIGTWPYLHCPATLAALESGKHVMCEARMAMNAPEARMMRDAAAARPDLVAQVVPSPFTLGVDDAVQRLVSEGFLGDVLVIEVRVAGGEFIDRDGPLHWRRDAHLSGVNVMALGIWYEALMRWVGEAVSVAARTRVFIRQRRDPATGRMRAVRVPDHVDVVADMACGAQAHFVVSSVMGFAGADGITLYGAEGTLQYRDGALLGARRGDDELRPIEIPPEERGGWRVEEEFVGAIRGAEPIRRTTFDDGVKYMEFTEAVARSAAERRMIPLPVSNH
jgi:predicted dehydrogenase